MTDLVVQSLAIPTGEYLFVGEASLSAADKGYILGDWQRFISSGFKRLGFSRELYRFLHTHCAFVAHQNLDTFWAYYFDAAETIRLRLFLNQFGGDGRSAELGTTAWLGGPAFDLKQAMCQEMAYFYPPLLQVLADLEFKHAELSRAWREFALAAGLPDPGFPTHYLVSENTRNLLAYAAQIALALRQAPPPLQALQLRLPMPPTAQPAAVQVIQP
jgi:hypothetical protein